MLLANGNAAEEVRRHKELDRDPFFVWGLYGGALLYDCRENVEVIQVSDMELREIGALGGGRFGSLSLLGVTLEFPAVTWLVLGGGGRG